jgi:hypothetical protein
LSELLPELKDVKQLALEFTSVEMSSIFRTDPEAYNDKKQKHLKRFYSKVVTKIELN